LRGPFLVPAQVKPHSLRMNTLDLFWKNSEILEQN
jgi:hypothetical protein